MRDCTTRSFRSDATGRLRPARAGRYTFPPITERLHIMVLIYESDPLDDEDARGRFYHVCRGRIIRTEVRLPEGQSVYECSTCGIDLEPEDFWIARQKGSV